jgi:hypothetical protein
MSEKSVHTCKCARCRMPEADGTRDLHVQLNQFLSSLDDNMRLQFLGLESMTAGYGGDQELEVITGVKATAIAKARWGIQQKRLAGSQPSLESAGFDYGKKTRTTIAYQTKMKGNDR